MNTQHNTTPQYLSGSLQTVDPTSTSPPITINGCRWAMVTTDDTSGTSTFRVIGNANTRDNTPVQYFTILIPPTGILFLPVSIANGTIINNDSASHTYATTWAR